MQDERRRNHANCSEVCDAMHRSICWHFSDGIVYGMMELCMGCLRSVLQIWETSPGGLPSGHPSITPRLGYLANTDLCLILPWNRDRGFLWHLQLVWGWYKWQDFNDQASGYHVSCTSNLIQSHSTISHLNNGTIFPIHALFSPPHHLWREKSVIWKLPVINQNVLANCETLFGK